MLRRLCEGLRNILEKPEPVPRRRDSTDNPISPDQIKIVYTPRGYIEAGVRLMREIYEERFGR